MSSALVEPIGKENILELSTLQSQKH